MENETSNKYIQQHQDEQGLDIPIADAPPNGIDADTQTNNQQTSQISSFEKQVNKTRSLMEVLTAIMALIAFAGVAVAYYQGQITKTQFYQDQRPYVISRFKEVLVFEANKEIAINITNGNYGKTPALKSGGIGKVFVGRNAMLQADQWFKKQASNVFTERFETIIPQNTVASGPEATVSTLATERAIGIEEFNSIINNDFFLVIGMRQAYTDSIGKLYWTDFCVSFLRSGAIANCTTHNEVN